MISVYDAGCNSSVSCYDITGSLQEIDMKHQVTSNHIYFPLSTEYDTYNTNVCRQAFMFKKNCLVLSAVSQVSVKPDLPNEFITFATTVGIAVFNITVA